jgi:hypothetical protein
VVAESLIIIGEHKVRKLVKFREQFGSPTFFKVFRAFYKLSLITFETQNNPLALYMTRQSCIRGFKEVVGLDVEELAARFFALFTVSKAELLAKTAHGYKHREDTRSYPARKDKVSLLRFLKVVWCLIDVESEDQLYVKYWFLFYDGDLNGSIGSVDILSLVRGDQQFLVPRELLKEDQEKALALTKHDTSSKALKTAPPPMINNLAYLERLMRTFCDARIRRDIAARLALHFTQSPHRKSGRRINVEQYTKKKDAIFPLGYHEQEYQPTASTTLNQRSTMSISALDDQSSDEDIQDPLQKFDEYGRTLKSWWPRFLVELYCLRKYFIEHTTKGFESDFIDFREFEQKFLAKIEGQYDFRAPALAFLFREKLVYQFPFSHCRAKEQGSMFKGFRQKHRPATQEVTVTDELIKMQKALDAISQSRHQRAPVKKETK